MYAWFFRPWKACAGYSYTATSQVCHLYGSKLAKFGAQRYGWTFIDGTPGAVDELIYGNGDAGTVCKYKKGTAVANVISLSFEVAPELNYWAIQAAGVSFKTSTVGEGTRCPEKADWSRENIAVTCTAIKYGHP